MNAEEAPLRGSAAEVLRVATPLILASSSHAVRLFCDRVMLAHHDHAEFSASLSAGITAFTLSSLFMFTAGYASTFVAQYIGAGKPGRVGLAVWQGIYLALLGGLLLASGALWGRPFFAWTGSTGEALDHQSAYFAVLSLGGVFPLLTQAIGSFWTGRGKTWTIAGLEWFAVALNLGANWVLIPGRLGFPAMGITGAGLGTVLSSLCAAVAAFWLFLRPSNRRLFGTLPGRTLDPGLLARMVRYGLPNGAHVFLDVAAFNLFVLLVHSLGPVERAACTMAFSVNAMAFIPMLGVGLTATILVGQCVGARAIAKAKLVVRNCLTLVVAYNALMTVLFLGFPGSIRVIFPLAGMDSSTEAWELGALFLRYIAAYLLFDGLFTLYKCAINGAGDTRFSMWASIGISWLFFAIPCLVAHALGASVLVLWTILVSNVVLAAAVFLMRYLRGRWQSMRVIEG